MPPLYNPNFPRVSRSIPESQKRALPFLTNFEHNSIKTTTITCYFCKVTIQLGTIKPPLEVKRGLGELRFPPALALTPINGIST
jgi:hypothetical protein